MRKISLFMMVSLDGFFEGPSHELDWHNVDAEFNEFAAAQLDAADTLLFGRKTYQLMSSYWPTQEVINNDPLIAKRMNTMSKLLFSDTFSTADWLNTRLVIRNDFVAETNKLKEQPGKDILMLGSNNLAVSFIEMGLLDEVRIMVNPVAIGKGNSLFTGITKAMNLKLLSTKEFKSGNVLLTYAKI